MCNGFFHDNGDLDSGVVRRAHRLHHAVRVTRKYDGNDIHDKEYADGVVTSVGQSIG